MYIVWHNRKLLAGRYSSGGGPPLRERRDHRRPRRLCLQNLLDVLAVVYRHLFYLLQSEKPILDCILQCSTDIRLISIIAESGLYQYIGRNAEYRLFRHADLEFWQEPKQQIFGRRSQLIGRTLFLEWVWLLFLPALSPKSLQTAPTWPRCRRTTRSTGSSCSTP